MTEEQLERLAEKKLLGTITPEEQALLDRWMNRQNESSANWEGPDSNEEALKARLLTRIKESAGIEEHKKVRRIWPRWAAAAAIIILFAGSYFIFFNSDKKAPTIAKNNPLSNDVAAPVTNRAMIKLDNGQVIYLDSTNSGAIAKEGDISITKLADGQIAYNGSSDEIRYNTLSNPRGSKAINITLSDGSKVWLNSESSLRYPASFTGTDRKVEITGEAYFEVSPSTSKPFFVSKGAMEVQVLGTHFNVNAYDDESEIKVTLLEGSVKINQSTILKPGQQAKINSDINVTSAVDMEQVMAWKNELFSLKGADIKTVMRQLARWYDVDIEYQGNINEKFVVAISRNTNVSNVFKILEATGGVHFKIEGRKITVLP